MSRLESGSWRPERKEFDLSELTETVCLRMRPRFEEAHTSLTFHAAGPQPGRWDRTRIEQVITNLLSNALKYGDDKPVTVSLDGDDASVRLVVEDEGIGIRSEDQPRLAGRAIIGGFSNELFRFPFVYSVGTVAIAAAGIVVVLLVAQAPALRSLARSSIADAVRVRE